MSIQAKQAEFMVACDQRIRTLRETLKLKSIPKEATLYMNLIEEEFKELEGAFSVLVEADYEDAKLAALADLLDGVSDLAVVMMGLCNSLGLPFQEAFNEVHRSNMTKTVKQLDGSYKVMKRADGKVMKPADFKRPDIMSILKYRLVTGG